MGAQHDKFQLQFSRSALPNKIQPRQHRHCEIHDNQIHRMLLHEFQRQRSVRHIPRHGKSTFFPRNNRNQSFSCKLVIIHYQYTIHVTSPWEAQSEPLCLLLFYCLWSEPPGRRKKNPETFLRSADRFLCFSAPFLLPPRQTQSPCRRPG